jgi:uncharacterized protein (DUF58 family)
MNKDIYKGEKYMKKILEVRPWVYVMIGVALLLIEMMVIIPSANGFATALVGTLALGLMLTGSIASIFKSIKRIRKTRELKEIRTGDVTYV